MTNNEIRVAKTFALIIGTFILFWTPLTIVGVVVAYKRDSHYFDNDESARIWFMFSASAAHLNSAIDPVIYAYRIKEVRVLVQRTFRCDRWSVGNEVEHKKILNKKYQCLTPASHFKEKKFSEFNKKILICHLYSSVVFIPLTHC